MTNNTPVVCALCGNLHYDNTIKQHVLNKHNWRLNINGTTDITSNPIWKYKRGGTPK